MRSNSTLGRSQLVALQGLRATAALLVVVDHALFTMARKGGAAEDLGFASFLGDLGVRVFFVISGFVMVVSHGEDFGKGRSGVFILKRIGRIVPFYWLTSAIYYLKLSIQGTAPDIKSVVLSMVFIPHQEMGDAYGRPFYGLGWTLQYEMVFYLLFALALLLPIARGLIALSITFVSLVALRETGILGTDNPAAYFGEPIVLYFLAGVALGVVRRHLLARSPWTLDFGPALGFAVLTIVTSAVLFGKVPETAAGITACAFACAACMLTGETSKRSLPRSLATMLGNATFSIYLTHSFLVGPSGGLVAKFWPDIPKWIFASSMIIASAAFGILVYQTTEMRLLKAWSEGTKRASEMWRSRAQRRSR